MAKSDIIASLKLKSTDYEQKLAKAKESTRKFSKDGGNGLADIAGKFGKLAAAVAGSQAAMAAFNKVMNSSQTYADNYANAINTVKGVVDNVVYSLANADFSSFERGLRKVAEASWAASAALDQLWNTKQSASYFTAKNRAQLADLLNIARDESSTAEQRKRAQAMIDAVIKDQEEVVATTRKDVDNAIYAMINKASGGRLGAEYVNRAVVEQALRIDVSTNREELKKQLNDQYQAYLEESKAIAKKYPNILDIQADKMGRITSFTWLPGAKEVEELNALDAKYSDIIAQYSVLEVMSDEQLANLISELNYAEQNEKIMEKMVAQAVALNNQLTKSKELAKLTGEQYAQSFGINYYNTLGNTLAGKAQRGYIPIQDVPIIDENTESSLSKAPVVLNKITESSYTAVDGINAISGAMSNLSGAVGEGAGAWLDWGANVLSSIAAAIPAITALTAAKEAEATANTAAAASGAASSVASIPYVGAIMAVGAIASVIAALAKLPKFATGGVVPGNALSGDNVLIRANSGEVVLTKQQANNIGSALSGLGGTVKFKIEGGDLVGVLNNHNRITSRSYGN